MLGRHISRLKRACDKAVGAGDIDDPPMLSRRHMSDAAADCVKGRRQIDGDDLVPFVWRKILNRRYMLDASIIDQHIKATKLVLYSRHHGRYFAGYRHVGGVVVDVNFVLCHQIYAQFFNRAFITQTIEDDVMACLCERVGYAKPDATGRARNKGQFRLFGLRCLRQLLEP